MPDNIVRSAGRPQGYKFDRGGMPTEMGPFIGIVKNNVDASRTGRLSVYIEQFGKGNPDDQSLWRTVAYVPPFYGATNPPPSSANNNGTFVGNKQSYGMWFTPPDLGTQVFCFFVAGDPNQGYYMGCVPEQGVTHMIPAVGASRKYQISNQNQQQYFSGATQLPVTEINVDNEKVAENPRYFDQAKPIHNVLAGIFFQQGLIDDTVRGPITSTSQRESPSSVFGISTPGKPVYQGGLSEADIKSQLERGTLKPQDAKVIARRGGHSIVLDDGDIEGRDQLIRIRTSKGHQITMSDDGDCFYIVHANGQTWMEFGKQGTVDVYSTNSINLRTQGTLNLHADKNINMYAEGSINMKATRVKIQSDTNLDIIGKATTIYGQGQLGIKSDGSLTLNSRAGGWKSAATLNLKARMINLNGTAAASVKSPRALATVRLSDTSFVQGQGWVSQSGALETIVTRAPTHEPYPYHNQGVNNTTSLVEPTQSQLTDKTQAALNSLDTKPVTQPITSSDVLSVTSADLTMGTLDNVQVTSLMASAAKESGQGYSDITNEKGIGRYGFTAQQLESAGYIKPGTVETFITDPSKMVSVLSSPTVWTGKGNVTDLNSLLSDSKLQDATQNELMVGAYNGLKSAGIVSGNENPVNLAPMVQSATKYGVSNVGDWVLGKASASVAGLIDNTAKNAQYAINYVTSKATNSLLTGVRNIGGYTNTVIRTSVDKAVENIIDDPKVPSPSYSTSLFSAIPTSQLYYDGNDPVELERINLERLSRGLGPIVRDTSGSSSEEGGVANPESYDP